MDWVSDSKLRPPWLQCRTGIQMMGFRHSMAYLICDSIDEVLHASEVIVTGNSPPGFRQALERARPGQVIVDLVRIAGNVEQSTARYQGICW
jgi:GDP-mannose 6-dehydrogenase